MMMNMMMRLKDHTNYLIVFLSVGFLFIALFASGCAYNGNFITGMAVTCAADSDLLTPSGDEGAYIPHPAAGTVLNPNDIRHPDPFFADDYTALAEKCCDGLYIKFTGNSYTCVACPDGYDAAAMACKTAAVCKTDGQAAQAAAECCQGVIFLPGLAKCSATKLSAGQSCAADADCATGSCANLKCSDKKSTGEQCAADADCASGSCMESDFIDTRVCNSKKPCALDTECIPSEYCNLGARACIAKYSNDKMCTGDKECQSNMCIAGKCATCRPTTCAALGAACGSINDGCGATLICGECPAGQACADNKCSAAPKKQLGESCALPTDVCDTGLWCDPAANTCQFPPQPKRPNGESCNAGGECLSNYCKDNKCEALCAPTAAACPADKCGEIDNGCGAKLICALQCQAGESCGADNKCSAAPKKQLGESCAADADCETDLLCKESRCSEKTAPSAVPTAFTFKSVPLSVKAGESASIIMDIPAGGVYKSAYVFKGARQKTTVQICAAAGKCKLEGEADVGITFDITPLWINGEYSVFVFDYKENKWKTAKFTVAEGSEPKAAGVVIPSKLEMGQEMDIRITPGPDGVYKKAVILNDKGARMQVFDLCDERECAAAYQEALPIPPWPLGKYTLYVYDFFQISGKSSGWQKYDFEVAEPVPAPAAGQ